MTIYDWQKEVYEESPEADVELPDNVMLDKFKEKAREWAREVVELINTSVTDPTLKKKKSKLMKWAKVIKKGVESITGSIDELDNVGVGVAPLIPVAVVGASLAAIAKWRYDYKKFKETVALHREMTASGTSATEASKAITNMFGAKSFINLSGKNLLLPLLLVGGGVAYLAYSKKRGTRHGA